MSNSTAISQLKAALENAYQLGKIDAIGSIATDEEEYLKANGAPIPPGVEDLRSAFRVTSSNGSYFLKRVSSWVSGEQLMRVEAFFKWAEEKQLSISPKLIAPNDGGGHVGFGDERYQMFEFVEQEKRQNWMNNQISQSDCRVAGELLFRMYLAFNDYLSFGPNSDEQQNWPSGVLEESSGKWKNLVSILEEKSNALPKVFVELVSFQMLLTQRLSAALDAASKGVIVDDGKTIEYLVHGDFHPGNVLVSSGKDAEKAALVIDFDHMHYSSPLFDVGYALVMFGKVKNSQQEAIIDWALARAFIGGFITPLYAEGFRDVSGEALLELSKIMQEVVDKRINADLLPAHMTIACFMIIDWAADRFLNGPQAFRGLYEGIVGDMLQILLSEDFNKAADIYFELLKELVG